MDDLTKVTLERLGHDRDDWEKFLVSKQWKAVTATGQARVDELIRKLTEMPVKGLDDVLALLDARAELRGYIKHSLIPSEFLMDIQTEVDSINKQGDENG